MKTYRQSTIERRARRFLQAARSLDGNGRRNGKDHLVSDEQFELIFRREVELTVRQIEATGGRILD